MWIEYNPNPLANDTGDCAVRALTKALDISWEKAFLMLAANGYAMGFMPDKQQTVNATLRKAGFKRKLIPDECPDCYTAEDFAGDHNDGKPYLLAFDQHIAFTQDGDIYDSWDSSKLIPIYYWYKDEQEA